MTLPIKRVTLYKHGLGFFERRGNLSGTQLRLEFPRPAMDDILKSLVVIDSLGHVLGLEFETPPDRNKKVHRSSLILSNTNSLTDSLIALRGRNVRLHTNQQTFEGMVIGVDLEGSNSLERAILSLYQPDSKRIITMPLERTQSLEILDTVAAGDLEFALQNAKRDEDRSSALLRLSDGDHDLSISYIAPAPAWRVSYRIIAEELEGDPENPEARDIFIQGWGLFDNTLEEDLEGVELSLMAGMPVSFRYALFEPNTPERPMVEDEERTVSTPIQFDYMDSAMSVMAAPIAAAAGGMARSQSVPKPAAKLSSQMMESAKPVSSGEARGALFAYRVAHLVSVARGQSGMVPLLAAKMKGKRELLYNGAKHPENPVASLRFQNTSSLTLERGPITVLESRDYAGEAVLDFTPSGAEVIVAFAIELGITVTEVQDWQTAIEGLSIQHGYLLVHEYRTCRTRYQIVSKLEKPVIITLERDRLAGFEFYNTAQPSQENLTLARWNVELPARAKLEFLVQERLLQARHEHISHLTFEALRDFLKNKYLDASTFEALKNIRSIYGQIENHKSQIQALETEQKRIFARQNQIQGNLVPLTRDGDEGRLRSKLVRELDESENRLKTTESEILSLKQLIVQLDRDANNAIAALG